MCRHDSGHNKEMNIEAVLLTGGESRRMGRDKAQVSIGGVPMAERIATELAAVCLSVTVLGTAPLSHHAFVHDHAQYEGPLVALAGFVPTCEYVFVASCDLPIFNRSVVLDLAHFIGDADGCVPVLDGRLQPLCGLYRASAWTLLIASVAQGERRIMRWIDGMQVEQVEASSLSHPRAVANANTPEELIRLTGNI
jgi:molybdopterin-guanine dinucleotide biosynthesis protein A